MGTHLLRPGLSAENAGFQLYLAEETAVAERLREIGRVGGSAAEHGSAELSHHHHLALGVACRHRDDRCTDALCALMCAEAAGEEAVAVADLNDVVRVSAGSGESAGNHLGPDFDIIFRVTGDNGLAGRSRRTLDADDVRELLREKSVGELVAKIRLLHERKLLEIVDGVDVRRLDAHGVHAFAVERYVGVLELSGFAESFALELAKLLAIHALHGGVVDLVDFRLFHSASCVK